MSLFEGLEVAYATGVRLNSGILPDNGRFYSKCGLALCVAPALLPALPENHTLPQIALVFALALLVVFVFTHFRARSIERINSALPQLLPMRARLVLAAYMFTTVVVTSLLGLVDGLLGLVSLVAFACIPLRRLLGVAGAP